MGTDNAVNLKTMGIKRTTKSPPKTLPALDIVLNAEQADGYEIIKKNAITYINGKAGSGKTLLALYAALDALHGNKIDKIFVVRPYVLTEDYGFLPGDIDEKMSPLMAPIFDNLMKLYPDRHKSNGISKIEQYMEAGEIEIATVAFMRGRTFSDAYVIADEVQNMTEEQIEMVLSRLGTGSKMIVCGDIGQCDLKKSQRSGVHLLKGMIDRGIVKSLSSIFLKENHRAPIVQDILDEIEIIKAQRMF